MDPIDVFRAEVHDRCEELERALIGLEERPDDRDQIAAAFRALHTIKGSGAMFDVPPLVDFTHQLETVFVEFRDGRAVVTPAAIDLTLSARDHITTLLDVGDAPLDERTRDTGAGLIGELERLVGIEAGPGGPPPRSATTAPGNAREEPDRSTAGARDGDTTSYRITYQPSRDTFRIGANPLAVLRELASLGDALPIGRLRPGPHLAVDAPPPDPTDCLLSWEILLATREPRSAIDDVFMFVDEQTRVSIEAIPTQDHRRLGEILVDQGAVERDVLERFLESELLIGQRLVRGGLVSPDDVEDALVEQQWSDRRTADGAGSATTRPGTAAIRVSTDRLDRLVNLVGEFVSLEARIANHAAARVDRELTSYAEQLSRLVRETRELSMEMHMIPVDTLFAPFRRLVRDLARDLGREITLSISGGETELDRNVVDALRDPLVHVVRNAIDHGIEPPDARVAAGKSRSGRLSLEAAHAGAEVLIVVEDDGAGIDVERVRRRAAERGLLAADASITPAQAHELLFQPGFSTAAEATSVSGRGVGMDVVRRNVERLRGSVALSDRRGGGTRVEIRIPLTLAIVEGLLCQVGEQYYLVNIDAVRACIDGAETRVTRSGDVFDFRGTPVPLIYLAHRFGIDGVGEDDPVVVVATSAGPIAIVVSRLHGTFQSVVKPLGRLFDGVDGISGAVFLGDGTPALMIDTEGLARTVAR